MLTSAAFQCAGLVSPLFRLLQSVKMDTLNKFTSNCTLPPEGTKFVSAPKIRGTLGIFWSCISILLLCTYKILHQNVLLQSTPDPDTWQKLRRTCYRILDKVGWMTLNLVAPEFTLAKAWSDRQSANLAQAKMEELVTTDRVPWTTTHTHFANMGGFSISFRHLQSHSGSRAPAPAGVVGAQLDHSEPRSTRSEDTQSAAERTDDPSETGTDTSSSGISLSGELSSYGDLPDSIRAWSTLIGTIDWNLDQTNLRLVESAPELIRRAGHIPLSDLSTGEEERLGSTWEASWHRNLEALQGDLWVLDAHQLRIARELGIISSLPTISEDYLRDRDKGDILTTVIALGQIGWFIIQLIVRLSQQDSTSQLEVMTLSFAINAAITYSLLWGRPKDITYSITLTASRYPQSPDEIIRLALWGPSTLLPQKLREILDSADSRGENNDHLWRPRSPKFYLARFSRYVSVTLGMPNFAIHIDHDLKTTSAHFSASAIVSGGTAMLVFGSLHFIAWNFAFPTTFERWLWRVGCIIGVATPACGILVHLAPVFWPFLTERRRSDSTGYYPSFKKPLMDVIKPPMYLGLLVCYTTARCFILVEVFRSLAFLPSDVFKTSWPANLPHIT